MTCESSSKRWSSLLVSSSTNVPDLGLSSTFAQPRDGPSARKPLATIELRECFLLCSVTVIA
jgi:hypothetical protein